MPRYSVYQSPIQTLLSWVNSGDVAIPEIQRPFVWDAVKVRNLLDSLYHGFPIGYLIVWKNPTVKLKDGSQASGKRILIDGQQRMTALMAALLGKEVLNKDYQQKQIHIAFHPCQERFEVRSSSITSDPSWINDVARFFLPDADLFEFRRKYMEKNPEVDEKQVGRALQRVKGIEHSQVGVIELADELDIETVTEIFVRVNSAGTPLSQADFAMSKIAVNETFGGNLLRKAIDYFCHLAVSPSFYSNIEKGDPEFTDSEFWPKMKWLKSAKDDLYDPTYTDILRVAFVSKFHRGRLADLVALLSGRDFETKEFQEAIAEQSFDKLKSGIHTFMNQTNFNRVTLILRSAGFLTKAMNLGHNTVNFAFIIFLQAREAGLSPPAIERLVRRWYVMSLLTKRYSGSAESVFDRDIRQIANQGLLPFTESVIQNQLPDTYWTGMLPQQMETSSQKSPYFIAYQAAQAQLGDKGFLSSDITVRDLLLHQGHRHHVFPRQYLKQQGETQGSYNQIANFVVSQSEINIAIGAKPPDVYFSELAEQVNGGAAHYGGIVDRTILEENLQQNCIPLSLLDGTLPDYNDFLSERRKLMALKIKDWFQAL